MFLFLYGYHQLKDSALVILNTDDFPDCIICLSIRSRCILLVVTGWWSSGCYAVVYTYMQRMYVRTDSEVTQYEADALHFVLCQPIVCSLSVSLCTVSFLCPLLYRLLLSSSFLVLVDQDCLCYFYNCKDYLGSSRYAV